MGADGVDVPVVHDRDAVRFARGRDALGDDDLGHAGAVLFQCLVERRLGPEVEGARAVVEDEDLGVFEERSGDGDALALAAGEAHTALRDGGVVAVRLGEDEILGLGDLGGPADGLLIRIRTADGNVVSDGGAEEFILLRDESDLAAQGREVEFFDIDAVHFDGARRGVVASMYKAPHLYPQ